MGNGVGTNVFIIDENENLIKVTSRGNLRVTNTNTSVKIPSLIVVPSSSGGIQLQSQDTSEVWIQSESGNNIMWIGGVDTDAPYSGHGYYLYAGPANAQKIPIDNMAKIRIFAATSGQFVSVMGLNNGSDVELEVSDPLRPDAIPPVVSGHSPVSGLSGVARNTEVTVLFSEPIDSNTITLSNFFLTPNVSGQVYIDPLNSDQMIFHPLATMSGSTVFTVKVSGITDLNGNQLQSGLTFPFTTEANPPPADSVLPRVSGTNPVSGQTDVVVSSGVTIIFSEAMLSGSINTNNVYLTTVSGGSTMDAIPASVQLQTDNITVRINPDSDLDPGVKHWINLLSGCADLASNGLSGGDRLRTFTTKYTYTSVYLVSTTSKKGDLFAGNDTSIGAFCHTTVVNTDLGSGPLKKIRFNLRKVGNPTGYVYVRMRDISWNPIGGVSGTFGLVDGDYSGIAISGLSTSFTDYDFINLANTHTPVYGTHICVEFSGGDSSNFLEINRNETNAAPGTSYFEYDGSDTIYTDREIAGQMWK